MKKNIIVNGACGRMGQEVVKTVHNNNDYKLVGVCDQINVGKKIGDIVSVKKNNLVIKDNLQKLIDKTNPDIVIDFTTPGSVMNNIKTTLANSVDIIVGTTGITEVDLKKIDKLCSENNCNALVVPNFAVGAVLMMRFAEEAARYLNNVEIIELHHDQKVDAPSGTAIKTAEMINESRNDKQKNVIDEIEKIKGARGGDHEGIKIHSVRLPGMVAHQEVIFGAEGQSLKIRHDSYDRRSFMPGVRLALDKISSIDGLVYGLEKLMK